MTNSFNPDAGAGIVRGGAPADARAFRVDEFARRYRISRSTVYQLIGAGKLHSVLIAGRRVIPATEGDRLLREGA